MQPDSADKSNYRCPNCKKKVKRESSEFPFCSERCRVIDLGRWATGDYRIAGDPVSIPDDPEDHG